MPREITEHKHDPANGRLDIFVVDEPGAGGANHAYFIVGAEFENNPGDELTLQYARDTRQGGCAIIFQDGPVTARGVNGLTSEVLLAILADRLRGFQLGPYANEYNEKALAHIEQAQIYLTRRTHDRMQRGVEGTYEA
jgi:hypothetical protein